MVLTCRMEKGASGEKIRCVENVENVRERHDTTVRAGSLIIFSICISLLI